MTEQTYTINTIGEVFVDEQGFGVAINDEFKDALTGLDGFNYVNVLFWCHLLDSPEYRKLTIADQPYKEGPAKLGIFATRSPARPNPIALTPVQVLRIDHEAGVIRIPFIDAEPGSPVLDVKPYHPAVDRIRDVTTPDWCADWPQWYEDSATFDWSTVFEFAQ